MGALSEFRCQNDLKPERVSRLVVTIFGCKHSSYNYFMVVHSLYSHVLLTTIVDEGAFVGESPLPEVRGTVFHDFNVSILMSRKHKYVSEVAKGYQSMNSSKGT